MAKERVRIFEVGPRDGLQNEAKIVSFRDKSWFISSLVKAGIEDIEAGAFVRPDKVPQMADSDLIFSAIRSNKIKLKGARAWGLVPNVKGLQRALSAGARHLALFTAASESFNRKNIGMSIQESLIEFRKIMDAAESVRSKQEIHFRGYISTAFGCPFEGRISPKKVLRVVEELARLGVDQISIGDTIGVGTPGDLDSVLVPALKLLGPEKIAVHFHDTRGTALANVLRSLELGVRVIDSSAGGLGGCPFAPGASGNLATEDLVYMLNGMGLRTSIDLDRLAAVSLKFAKKLKRPLTSRYLQSL